MKIVAFSDQHGQLGFELPPADLYLCAGDVCTGPTFLQEKWLASRWATWMGGRRYLATFGNHDFLEKWQAPKGFKVDETVEVKGVNIWLSPWSCLFGNWAWMEKDIDLAKRYARIPNGTDIIVSHQPPYGLGDQLPPELIRPDEDPSGHVGSKSLLETILRVEPKFVVCGHIHNGRGAYMIGPTTVLNVCLVNEAYKMVHKPVEFEI